MPFEDEMPQAPTSQATDDAVSFDGNIDASVFDTVPNLGDAVPAGVYEARLKSFNAKKNDKGPFFSLAWVLQSEPVVGRMVFENYVPWVDTDTINLAKAGNPTAQAMVADRLPRIKAIMKAAEFKPTGSFDVKQFLGSSPEVKLQISVKEKKQKDASGAYVGTGEMENGVVKYLSKIAPR